MASTNEKSKSISVDVPSPDYTNAVGLWKKIRAVAGGQLSAKAHDNVLDVIGFSNLLIPFSKSMDFDQYKFYLAEAELPGISAQFFKILVGALLKTAPEVTFPPSVSEEGRKWIINSFSQNGGSLQTFIQAALEEEILTTRAWIFVDRAKIDISANMDIDEIQARKPFPVLWKAEDVISWKIGTDASGKRIPTRIVVRRARAVDDSEDEFKQNIVIDYIVHEIKDEFYQVRIFKKKQNGDWDIELIENILVNNVRLNYIPAWPLNGECDIQRPMLETFVHKEIALYNKVSRRNHLLYNAATYTPYISSDMAEDEFNKLVDQGLGTWFKIGKEDKAGVLAVPTEALKDYDRTIEAGYSEIARLGFRLLTPEVSQSGVALEIRNVAQTSQIGFMGQLVDEVFSRVIAFMLNWRYNLDLQVSDISVKINTTFTRQAVNIQWAELVTEWYQNNLIPRSLWLSVIKSSDLIPPEYDDKKGVEELEARGDNLEEETLEEQKAKRILEAIRKQNEG